MGLSGLDYTVSAAVSLMCCGEFVLHEMNRVKLYRTIDVRMAVERKENGNKHDH